jgi:fibronectin type 3 domain-containing protein
MKLFRIVFSFLTILTMAILFACGGGGGGGGSDNSSTTLQAPTGLTASVQSATSMQLSWNTVTKATSYNIYWSTTSGVTKANGTKISNVTSPYTHAGLTEGTICYYIVTAVNSNEESAVSSEVSAMPLPPPTDVKVSQGANSIKLSWTGITEATSYNIYWSTTTGVTKANGTKISNVTSPYNHTGLAIGTTYYYIVTAVNSNGESAASSEVKGVPIIVLDVPTNDIIWDPFRQVIYASLPSVIGEKGNSIAVIDPVTGNASAVFAGSEPDKLAISDDGRYLYVGLDGSASIQRFHLPDLTPDISISLGSDSFQGPYYAIDIQVAPGEPNTIAVSLGCFGVSPHALGGLVIFDDSTQRPTRATSTPGGASGRHLYDSIQWGVDASVLYAAKNELYPCNFYILSADSAGISLKDDIRGALSFTNEFNNFIHYDSNKSYIYTDLGQILNSTDGSKIGVFPSSGRITPDLNHNMAFILTSDAYFSYINKIILESYNLSDYTLNSNISITPSSLSTYYTYPARLVRWGSQGLAFGGNGSPLYIISGSFVDGGSDSSTTTLQAPAGLTASVEGAASMQLSWNTITDATSYNIYWSTTPGVTKANGRKISNVTSPHTHTGLTGGNTYYYIVTSVNSKGESAASPQVSAPLLTAPTYLTISVGVNSTQLGWTDVTDATSYNIYWSTTAGVTKANGTKISNVTSPYTHTGLINGTTYYYIVTAVTSKGESAASSEVSGGPVIVLDVPTNDIIWDPFHQVIYASLPSVAGENGNSIAVINPFTGNVSTVYAGDEPDKLAISDDGTYLYVGLNGSATIQRFNLPDLTPDISISLGSDSSNDPYFANDIQVAPGVPNTIAVTLGCKEENTDALGGVVIFDDSTQRAKKSGGFLEGGGVLYDSLQWGADASVIYAANNESTGFDFYILSVDSDGISLKDDIKNAFNKFNNHIHYNPDNTYVYSDSGQVLNSTTGAPIGIFQSSGPMSQDSDHNVAIFLSFYYWGMNEIILESFSLNHFTPISYCSIIPSSSSIFDQFSTRLIRWGSQGLAIGGNGSPLFITSGAFVLGN